MIDHNKQGPSGSLNLTLKTTQQWRESGEALQSYWMSRSDLVHHKLCQRCDALVGAVLPQPISHEILKVQGLLPQS